MSLALHVMEACGLLLAASSVRIVAGTAAGLAALALMVALRVSSGEQSVLILPASVAIALSLRPKSAWTAVSIAIALSSACAILLPCLCAVATFASKGAATSSYKPAALILSVAPAFWFLSGLREANGVVIAMTGLPLALVAADEAGAALLLVATNVAMGGLVVRSYRLKRHDATARLN